MRKRNKQINLYLSDWEYQCLERLTRKSGLDRSMVIRKLVLAEKIKEKPPEQYIALLRELSRIGGNINQVAKVANARQDMDQQSLEEIKSLMGEIWIMVKNE